MKKLFLVATAILVAFAFSACTKPEKTNEELLTQGKGWQLVSATSVPAFTNKDGISSPNLFVSFFYACELDDILYFYMDKSSKMDNGKLLCDWDEGKVTSLGNWRFIKNDKVLEFYLPYFFNDDDSFAKLEGNFVVDDNTLTLMINIDYDNGPDPAKSGKIVNDRGLQGTRSVTNYDFTLTYKVAK